MKRKRHTKHHTKHKKAHHSGAKKNVSFRRSDGTIVTFRGRAGASSSR